MLAHYLFNLIFISGFWTDFIINFFLSFHSARLEHVHHLSDDVSQIRRKLLCQPIGSLVWRRRRSRLPDRRPLLLLLSARDVGPRSRGSDPRHPLHLLHARILRILLKDLDRRVRIVCQGCKCSHLIDIVEPHVILVCVFHFFWTYYVIK